MDPESMAWNPNSETVLDFLSWRYLNIKKQPLLFSFHLPPPPISVCFSSQYSRLVAVVSAAAFSNIQSYYEYIVTVIKQSQ